MGLGDVEKLILRDGGGRIQGVTGFRQIRRGWLEGVWVLILFHRHWVRLL